MKNQGTDPSRQTAKKAFLALAVFFIFLLIVVFVAAFSQQ